MKNFTYNHSILVNLPPMVSVFNASLMASYYAMFSVKLRSTRAGNKTSSRPQKPTPNSPTSKTVT